MSLVRRFLSDWRASRKLPAELWAEYYERQELTGEGWLSLPEGRMFQRGMRGDYYAHLRALEASCKRPDTVATHQATATATGASDERKSDDKYYKKRVEEQERQSADTVRNFLIAQTTWYGPG
jgi:hypothetical protein